MPNTSKYPWETWFSRPTFDIEPGEDNVATAPSVDDREQVLVKMRAQVHTQAGWRGVRVKTRMVRKYDEDEDEDEIALQVTVFPPEQVIPPQSNWALLLNGQPHHLVPGVDFRGTPEEFIARAKTAARDRDVALRIKFAEGKVMLRSFAAEPFPISDFVKTLRPGVYRGSDLLRECREWQGDAAPASPQELARVLRDHGARRRRGNGGSTWLIS